MEVSLEIGCELSLDEPADPEFEVVFPTAESIVNFV
jgi:hypothetical protein